MLRTDMATWEAWRVENGYADDATKQAHLVAYWMTDLARKADHRGR